VIIFDCIIRKNLFRKKYDTRKIIERTSEFEKLVNIVIDGTQNSEDVFREMNNDW